MSDQARSGLVEQEQVVAERDEPKQGSGRRFRGVFAIPPTPFDDVGNIDEPSLRRCVTFCLEAGVHGLVMGVNASEAIALTDEERHRVAEVVIDEVSGRAPVIIGVSGVSTAASVAYAGHALVAGADAVMAMPPYVIHLSAVEIVAFYADVAKAAGELPVWIQDFVAPVGTPMSPALLNRILREMPGVEYLKEETAQAPQVMTAVQELAGNHLKGVMGGMAGRYLLDEYRRGACGTMPACEVADAHVLVWNALERGDEAEARRLHTQLLPLLNYEAMYGVLIYKEVLVRRGIISSARTRVPGAGRLDADNHRELDLLLRDLEPLLTSGLQPDLPTQGSNNTSNLSQDGSTSTASGQPSTFGHMPVQDVFGLWVSALKELRRRGILRSFNTPTGDYAEWLVAEALGLALEGNATSGFDATKPDGTRYQIKARWLATPKSSRQLSVIRNLDADPFDHLIVVLFGPDFEVYECWQIPIDVVREHARYVSHVNGHVLHARGAVLADKRVVRLHEVENME